MLKEAEDWPGSGMDFQSDEVSESHNRYPVTSRTTLKATVATPLLRVRASVATPTGTVGGVIRLGVEQEDVETTETPSL